MELFLKKDGEDKISTIFDKKGKGCVIGLDNFFSVKGNNNYNVKSVGITTA